MGMSTESKARSSLFREALHRNKCLLNQPFPGHFPSWLLGRECCVVMQGTPGDVSLLAQLPVSSELPHPPGGALAPWLIPHVGFAVAMQNSCLSHLPAPKQI